MKPARNRITPPTRPPRISRSIAFSPVFSEEPNRSRGSALSDQFADEIVQEDAARRLQPLRLQDVVDKLPAFLGIVVDQHIIIFGPVADLRRGALHPALDHLVRIGAAI